jgi:hypothetical protein
VAAIKPTAPANGGKKPKSLKPRSRRRKRQASRKTVTPWLPRHNSIPMHACARRIACGLRLYTISVFVIVGRATGGSSAWQSFRASVGQRILAGGDAVDVCQRWASPSLPGVHADTGLSQVQILPARPLQDMAKDAVKAQWRKLGRALSLRQPSFLLGTCQVLYYFTHTSALKCAICRVVGGNIVTVF